MILNRLRRLEYQTASAGPQVSSDLDALGAVQTVLQFNETTAPGTFPPLGVLYLYMDASDDHLKLLDSTGSVLDLSAGGSGGAPSNAQYLVLTANATLTVERIFTPGTALAGVDGGAGGAYTLSHAQVATGDLHQDYPLLAGTETISGVWTFSSRLLMTGRLEAGQGADVAAANDLTLGADGNVFEITGTTQINAITTATWQNGSYITLLFASNPTVKHNTAGGAGTAVMLLAGAADFASTAGDTLTLVLSEIGGTQAWREVARAVI